MGDKKDYYVGVGPNMVSPMFTRRGKNEIYTPRYTREDKILAITLAFLAIAFFFWFCNTFLNHFSLPGYG